MKKPSRRQLKVSQKNLKDALSYSEWMQAAEAYDERHGYDVWRQQHQSPFYPYELLQEQIATLRSYRRQGRPDLLVPYLQESLHRTLGELTDPQLYNVSIVGTKHLVESYLDEIESIVDYLCDTDFDFIDNTK